MAKRFIDTGLFDDPWFMDLSKDAKILWVYFITKCNHAGILDINIKLCQVQSGIKDIETVIKELGNRLVRVKEQLFFIPKFISFQYPEFPNSKVKQQSSAIEILTKYGLFDNGMVTVNKELTNNYGNDNDNGSENESVLSNEKKFEIFWDSYHLITGLQKSDREPAKKHWNRLKNGDRDKAIEMITPYFNSLNDKKYCKKARTYLADKNFNDENINKVVAPQVQKQFNGFIENPNFIPG